MEKKFQLSNNGQQVQQDDINLLGETAGLADDRVLAELFRLSPRSGSTISRGIIPYTHQTSATSPLVGPNGASGSVIVRPFRAFIGSRTEEVDEARENWRDIRSALLVAEGDTSLTQSLSISANASGNPRWDLVLAAVAVDANSATVTRKVKDPTTKVIASASVVTTKVCTVTLSVVTGTPGATPAFPATPSDSGGTYYIPLCYIKVPNGFGASSTVSNYDILLNAPVLSLSSATGAMVLEVANQSYVPTASLRDFWSGTSRPTAYMPSTLHGGTSLLVNLIATLSNGTVLDSRDWRGRLNKFHALSVSSTSEVWTEGLQGWFPNCYPHGGADWQSRFFSGMGQTIYDDTSDKRFVAFIRGVDHPDQSDSIDIGIYCDNADGGKLKVYIAGGSNAVTTFVWLDFSGVFENA